MDCKKFRTTISLFKKTEITNEFITIVMLLFYSYNNNYNIIIIIEFEMKIFVISRNSLNGNDNFASDR